MSQITELTGHFSWAICFIDNVARGLSISGLPRRIADAECDRIHGVHVGDPTDILAFYVGDELQGSWSDVQECYELVETVWRLHRLLRVLEIPLNEEFASILWEAKTAHDAARPEARSRIPQIQALRQYIRDQLLGYSETSGVVVDPQQDPRFRLPPPPRANEPVREERRRPTFRGIRNGRRDSNETSRQHTGTQEPLRAVNSESRTAHLDFDQSVYWQCADTDGRVQQYRITEMEDSHLYYTLEFIVANTQQLYQRYYRSGQDLTSIARLSNTPVHEYWLKTRAAFGSLLQEALRRGLTFPSNMVTFLTKNFAAGSPVRVATPWRTGVVQQEIQSLRANVETYYTEQAAQNAGQRAERFMS